MYLVAKGCHRGRGQRSRNVVVERSDGSAALSNPWCLGAILLMVRDSLGQYLLMLAIHLRIVPSANTYPYVVALSLLSL
jgi:hypothetical protein